MEPASEHGARSGPVLPALLLALLALPFDPSWLDFETARRGVLLVVAGALALTGTRWCPARLPAGTVPLAALCGLYLVRSIGVVNGTEALLRAAHWIALAVLFVWASRRRPEDVLRAALPAGLIVATYGTAQAIGLDWPAGYARPGEPVSTLGNRNVASEVATFALASAMALGARGSRRAFAAGLLIAIYVGLDGSRAGLAGALVALGLTGAAARGARGRLGALAALAVAVAIGHLARPTTPAPEPPAATGAIAATEPSTIDVRFEIWRGSLAMLADAPIVGNGSGQFRYAYPKYRTEREIELSTFGRRFPTFAESVHDDPLEIAVETGVLGLLLALGFAALVLRAALRRPRADALAAMAPLGALAVAALVRSPLGNAPAAAAAFALMGALAARESATAPRSAVRTLASTATGLALLAAGVSIVAGASCAARWIEGGDSVWIDRAVAWHGSESRYRSLRVLDRCGGIDDAGFLAHQGPAELDACREDLEALARLDPNNTNALFLTAQLTLSAGELDAARVALGRILTLDPREPRAQLLAALLLAKQGAVADAVATLYARPHAVLRARLAETLGSLAELPDLDATARRLLRREQGFVEALDALEREPGGDDANRAVLAFAGADLEDHRARALLARQLQARGRADEAAALAPPRLDVASAQRALMEPILDELAALPAWRKALGD